MTTERVATLDQRLLREAALSMRELHPMSHPRHEFWFKLADKMESEANRPNTVAGYPDEEMLDLARAYLATVGRPDIDGEIN